MVTPSTLLIPGANVCTPEPDLAIQFVFRVAVATKSERQPFYLVMDSIDDRQELKLFVILVPNFREGNHLDLI